MKKPVRQRRTGFFVFEVPSRLLREPLHAPGLAALGHELKCFVNKKVILADDF